MSARRRDHRWSWMLGGLVLAAGLSYQRPVSRIVFLQAGQGDCTLIQDQGWNVLLDATGADQYIDLGERLAVPELRQLGVYKIDAVLLTHPDQDHIGGLVAIAGRWRVGAVYMPAPFEGHPAVVELQRKMPGLHWIWVERGESLEFGSTRLTFDYAPGRDDNAGSLATLVEMGASRAVLTGDAPSESEIWLADRGDWQAELMKVGHHGSAGSTSLAWLNEVQPKFAVISCGRGNSYGHPNPRALERLDAEGIKTFRTDRDGTITFVPTGQGFQPENR